MTHISGGALASVEKKWGSEQVIVNIPEYCGKFLIIHAGKQSSLHSHAVKRETFYVLDGEALIRFAASEPWALFQEGATCHIAPGELHQFASRKGAVILEISTHHDDADVSRESESGDIND